MSKKPHTGRALGLTLLLLVVVFVGMFFAAKWLIGGLAALDEKVSAGLITASATVVVAVVSLLASKHLEMKTTIRAKLREKKEPTYKELIDFIFDVTFAQKLGREMLSEKQMMEFMAKTTRDLVIWGSPEVVKAFSNFKQVSQGGQGSADLTSRLMFGIEDIFRAIRKDLGHGDLLLQRGDILRLYINDLDTLL
jgi:hypothetical protein